MSKVEENNSKSIKYVWLVEPGDAQTNRVISEISDVAEEGSVLCKDGKHHDLWRMPGYHTVAVLYRSRRGLKLNFTVFCKRKNEAPAPVNSWISGTKWRSRKIYK